jgi:hypothetical protein
VEVKEIDVPMLDGKQSRPAPPHPVLAGLAWAALMALIGGGYSAIRFLGRRWTLGDVVVYMSRDQFWSFLMLVGVGFVFGFVASTLWRRRLARESGA